MLNSLLDVEVESPSAGARAHGGGYDLRRGDRALTDPAAIAGLLDQAAVGHLALSQAGQPYVVPLNFAHHAGQIFFHSAPEGRKINALTANPEVCFLAYHHYGTIHSNRARPHSSHYASVMAFGQARFVTEDEVDLRMQAMQRLLDKYAPGRHYHPLQARELAGTQIVAVQITTLTAKYRAPFYPNDRVRVGRHILADAPHLLQGCLLDPAASARVAAVDMDGWVHLHDHATPVRWEVLESVKGPM